MSNKLVYLVLAACAMSLTAGAGQLVYQEDFDGPGDAALNGKAVTVAIGDHGGSAGAAWSAGSGFFQNGASGGAGQAAWLPFAPQNGYEYAAMATVTAPDAQWIAFGFMPAGSSPAYWATVNNTRRHANNNAYAWMLNRNDTRVGAAYDNQQYFGGPSATNMVFSSNEDASNRTLKVVLNTRQPVWTAAFFLDDVSKGNVYALPASANNSTSGGIGGIGFSRSGAGATGTISDFTLTAVPFVPWDPSPATGAAGVALDVVFSWSKAREPNNVEIPDPRIVSHRLTYIVYDLAAAPAEPNFALPQAVRTLVADAADPVSSGPASFVTDKRVFWRVEHLLSEGDPIIGNTWRFDTLISVPQLIGQPTGVSVFAGAAAQLKTTFSSLSTASAVWKKYVDGTDDETLVTNEHYSIVTTAADTTLTVNDAQMADQGYYYCVISNESGHSVISENAALVIKRRLAYYAFENNLDDAEGGAAGVAGSNDPNYPLPLTFVPGRVGSYAVQLSNSSPAFVRGQHIDLGAAAFPKAGLGNGMEQGTISCWVKSDKVQSGVLLGNYNDGSTTGFAFSLVNNANARINVRGENAAAAAMDIGTVEARPSTSFMMFDNSWQHVAATWKAGDRAAVYVNGKEVGSVAGGTPELFLDWARGIVVGASRQSADRDLLNSYFAGAMDDLQVYNYALNKNELAKLYFDVTGIRPCINTFAAQYDYNGNCTVDLADFAVFAQSWLDSGVYQEDAVE
jgi:hypothetical protein